jgi:hypothetical protein
MKTYLFPEQVGEAAHNLSNVIGLLGVLHWEHSTQTEESQRGVPGESQPK